MKNFQELPKLKDSISYLYFEYAVIEQDDLSIAAICRDGKTPIPVAATTCLLLGPGTSITHAAIKTIAEAGCQVVWCGEFASRFYASGLGETHSAKNLLLQAEYCMDPEKHLLVAKRMYSLRFPGIDTADKTLQQLRGMEGYRVKKVYELQSKITGVKWTKRNYKPDAWEKSDPINKALSESNALLYGICHAAIVSMGFSPALGFIHTGNSRSFVYDIADLYKTETTIPASFEAVSMGRNVHKNIRRLCRQRFVSTKLLERIPKDLASLFESNDDVSEPQKAGALWEREGEVPSGRNYGGESW